MFDRYRPRPTRDETHAVQTADGWRLALHHYPPRGDNARGEPVILQHGLGTCAKQFDLGVGTDDEPVPSLATWLADRGYDVWAPDLRGVGDSERPPTTHWHRWSWTVNDYLRQDMPACIDYILARSRHERLHWVGHSMGGMLLLCHCALYGAPRIACGVVASGALDHSAVASNYRFIAPLRNLGRIVRRVPFGAGGRVLAPLFGRVPNPIEASFFWPHSIAPAAARAIPGGAHYDVPGQVLYQLSTLFDSGGLRSEEEVFPHIARWLAKHAIEPA